jgi:hypothetical protein
MGACLVSDMSLSGETMTTQLGDLEGMGAMRTIASTIADNCPDFAVPVAIVPAERLQVTFSSPPKPHNSPLQPGC